MNSGEDESTVKPEDESIASLPSGRRVRKLGTSQELEGLFSYCQSLSVLASEADFEEENDEDGGELGSSTATETEEGKNMMKDGKVDDELNEEDDEVSEFQKQCDTIKEMLPSLSMERIQQAVRESRSPDEAFSILFDYSTALSFSQSQEDDGGPAQSDIDIAVPSASPENSVPPPSAAAAAISVAEQELYSALEPAQREALRCIMEVLPECSEERAIAMLKKYGTADEALNHLLIETVDEELDSPFKPEQAAPSPQREEVKSIMEMLPDCSEERIVAMLKKYGSSEEALDHLLNETAEDSRVARISARFPDLPVDFVRSKVKPELTDVDLCIILQRAEQNYKKQSRAENKKKTKKKKTVEGKRVTDEGDQTQSSHFLQLKAIFPDKDSFYLSRLLSLCEDNVELATMHVLDGTEPIVESTNSSKSLEDDVEAPSVINMKIASQSLLSYNKKMKTSRLAGDVEQYIYSCFQGGGARSAFCVNCFKKMLVREQMLHQKYVVFYHSYSYAALLYEVHSVLASILLQADDDFPPLPRVLFRPFRDHPSLKKLMGTMDHQSFYRNCVLSVSNSIFAEESEAPPLRVFCAGYSCTDLSFSGLLSNILRSLGILERDAGTAAQDICHVAKKYHLDLSGCCGQMLQIFIRRDVVDDYAYESLPYGVPTGDGPISKLLTKTFTTAGTGQARVYAHPTLFLDKARSRLFYYSSDPTFTSDKRRLFRSELKQIILKRLPSEASLSKAARLLRGCGERYDVASPQKDVRKGKGKRKI